MMNAMQNIVAGTKELAEEREIKLADVQAQMKLEAGEVPAGEQGGADAGTAEELEVESMTPEQMVNSIQVLSKAVMSLTTRLDGGNE